MSEMLFVSTSHPSSPLLPVRLAPHGLRSPVCLWWPVSAHLQRPVPTQVVAVFDEAYALLGLDSIHSSCRLANDHIFVFEVFLFFFCFFLKNKRIKSNCCVEEGFSELPKVPSNYTYLPLSPSSTIRTLRAFQGRRGSWSLVQTRLLAGHLPCLPSHRLCFLLILEFFLSSMPDDFLPPNNPVFLSPSYSAFDSPNAVTNCSFSEHAWGAHSMPRAVQRERSEQSEFPSLGTANSYVEKHGPGCVCITTTVLMHRPDVLKMQ